MRLSNLYKEFFSSERSAGFILIFCTILSVILTNYILRNVYIDFWHIHIGGIALDHWINDGLMTIFFLLIGLELEREIYKGEFADFRNALLPIFAAIGGMIFPAAIYLTFNIGQSTQPGAGIPTATDIAFALGILSLLGNRVPVSLKIFLTALAVIDDLGAIIIIALFYTDSLIWQNLIIALSIFLLLIMLNRLNVKSLIFYVLGGVGIWYFMLHSGVHPTITGILLAFAIPFRKGNEHSPSYKLQHLLHKPVAFIILPLFALANTAIVISSGFLMNFTENYGLGIALGLIIGKPLGIFLLSFLVVKLGLSKLPEELNWKIILGTGSLGGMGFTMSIFITLLAFDNSLMIDNAKLVILCASAISGIIGYLILKRYLKEANRGE